MLNLICEEFAAEIALDKKLQLSKLKFSKINYFKTDLNLNSYIKYKIYEIPSVSSNKVNLNIMLDTRK